MSKKDDKLYQSYLSALVYYKVIDGKKKLLINTNNKEWLVKVQIFLKERYPDNQYIVRDFAVKVLTKNTITGEHNWEKIEGFSLWEIKKWQISV